MEADGQDLATTYILLEGRDESHEVLEAEDNLKKRQMKIQMKKRKS